MREVDLAIVGAGVAGLTAAAVAAKQGVRVLVIERMGAGGQVMNVDRIDNWPGSPEGISGYELGPLLQEQAEEAGAEFMLDTVTGLQSDGRLVLRCEGEDVQARAVILAVGSLRKPLGIAGEEEYSGRGVSHCASCDGPLLSGQPVGVVGGGDSAVSEALVLAQHASQVTLVFREEDLHAQPQLVAELNTLGNVALLPGCEVMAIRGNGQGVTGIALRTKRGVAEMPLRAVFHYAGLVPDTGFIGATLKLDDAGRIETDAQLQTAMPGVFAAGDVRSGAAWLLATAAREGEKAALAACAFIQT